MEASEAAKSPCAKRRVNSDLVMSPTKSTVTLQVPSPSPAADSENYLDEFVVPAKTFTRFAKLATELKLQIWKYATERPRTIELRTGTQDGCACFRSVTPNPAVLFVNRELRYEALKSYKLMFGTNKEDEDDAISPKRVIYFNPAIDTVYFDYNPYFTHQNTTKPYSLQPDMSAVLDQYRKDSPQEFSLLKRVALPLVQYGSWNPTNTVSKLVEQLDHTQEIMFVLRHELPGGSRDSRYAREIEFGDDMEEDVSSDWTIEKFRFFHSACFEARYRRANGIPMTDYLTKEQKEEMEDIKPKVSIRDMKWIDVKSRS